MKKINLILLGSFILLLTCSFQTSAKKDDTSNWLLTGVSLIDMESGAIKPETSIWIKNGIIEAINPTSVPQNVNKVSGEGRWLIPGLSEMHAHVPRNEEYTDRILKLFITHGVTNIRGMLGQASHLKLREELNSGEKLGPYLVTSGPSINGNSVKTPKQAKTKIEQQVEAGYDFHKIHPGLSASSYNAVTNTAKKLGSSWGGHISADIGIVDTVKAGQSTIDHMDGFVEELAARNGSDLENGGFFGFALAENIQQASIAKLVEQLSTYNYGVVPTETLMHSFAGDKSVDELMKNPAHKWMPKNVVQNWKSSRENFWSNEGVTKQRAKRFLSVRGQLIKEFQKQGVAILLGSDAPQVFNVPGDSLHREIALMVEVGLTPLQALQSGTLNINKYYQGKHPVGKIARGMRADLVLLNQNPLKNIDHTRDIDAVVVAGRLLNRKQLDNILKELE